MGDAYDVYAVQVNFAEHGTCVFGREKNIFHKYVLEHSADGTNWETLADRSENDTDNTHQYIQLDDKVSTRFIRIKNLEVPDGHFTLSGLRVFGKGNGEKPGKVTSLKAERNPGDRRSVQLSWEKAEGAVGYNISFGTDEGKLYQNYMVYSDTAVTINSLNAGQEYYFSIESFNENGTTEGGEVVKTVSSLQAPQYFPPPAFMPGRMYLSGFPLLYQVVTLGLQSVANSDFIDMRVIKPFIIFGKLV